MYRNSIDETLGTSLPSFLPGGDDVTSLGLNPAATSEADVRGSMGGNSQLDVLLQKAKNSTRGSSLGGTEGVLPHPQAANLPPAEAPKLSYQVNSSQFANLTPASPGRPQPQYNPPPITSTVFASQSPPPMPPSMPMPQYQQHPMPPPPVAAPVQPVPDIPPHDGSVEEESVRLQAQLAQQTGEMQRYLQTEMVRLSEAMKQTAAGVAAAAAAATVASPPQHQPVQSPHSQQTMPSPSRPLMAQPVLYPSQAVQPPSQQLSLRPSGQPNARPASHARSTSPLRNPHQPTISQSPSFSSPAKRPPAQFSPTGWVDVQRTAELTEMAQKRVTSPVWEGEKKMGLTPLGEVVITPSNFNSVTSCGEQGMGPRDSLVSTSLPSIRCVDSVDGHDRAAPLNPPSASDATETPGEGAAELGAKLRKALSNVHEAPQAMELAQALAVADMGKLVDILHQFSPTLERKEVAITWKSLVARYAVAAGKFLADKSGKRGSKSGNPRAPMYELDESLPPTPRSKAQSDFTLGSDRVGNTIHEVMTFMDKPLSPASLKRISTVRAKHDAKAASASPPQLNTTTAAYPIPFTMDPPHQHPVFNS